MLVEAQLWNHAGLLRLHWRYVSRRRFLHAGAGALVVWAHTSAPATLRVDCERPARLTLAAVPRALILRTNRYRNPDERCTCSPRRADQQHRLLCCARATRRAPAKRPCRRARTDADCTRRSARAGSRFPGPSFGLQGLPAGGGNKARCRSSSAGSLRGPRSPRSPRSLRGASGGRSASSASGSLSRCATRVP